MGNLTSIKASINELRKRKSLTSIDAQTILLTNKMLCAVLARNSHFEKPEDVVFEVYKLFDAVVEFAKNDKDELETKTLGAYATIVIDQYSRTGSTCPEFMAAIFADLIDVSDERWTSLIRLKNIVSVAQFDEESIEELLVDVKDRLEHSTMMFVARMSTFFLPTINQRTVLVKIQNTIFKATKMMLAKRTAGGFTSTSASMTYATCLDLYAEICSMEFVKKPEGLSNNDINQINRRYASLIGLDILLAEEVGKKLKSLEESSDD